MKKRLTFPVFLLCLLLISCNANKKHATEKFTLIKEMCRNHTKFNKSDFHAILGNSDSEKKTGLKNKFDDIEGWTLSGGYFIIYMNYYDRIEIGLWKKCREGETVGIPGKKEGSDNSDLEITQRRYATWEIQPGEKVHIGCIDIIIITPQ